jgi:hypothetical protein
MLDRETRLSLFGRFGLLGWGLAFFFIFFGSSYVPWSPMSKSRTIENQLNQLNGDDSEYPKVISAWRGKNRVLCGNIVKFTSREDVFATKFVAQPDGSDATARDLDNDNSTIAEWERRLRPSSIAIFSKEEVNAALAQIELNNAKFDKNWADYCRDYPLPREPDPLLKAKGSE